MMGKNGSFILENAKWTIDQRAQWKHVFGWLVVWWIILQQEIPEMKFPLMWSAQEGGQKNYFYQNQGTFDAFGI